jgi:putative membrane protein
MTGQARPNQGGSLPAGPRVIDRGEAPGDLASQSPAPSVFERPESDPIDPQVIAAPPRQAEFAKPTKRRRGFDWAVLVAVLGIGIFALERLTVDAVGWIAATYERNAVLGGVAFAALLAGVAGVLFIIARELRSFFAMRSVEALQGELDNVERMSMDAAQRFIDRVLSALRRRPDSRSDIAVFERQVRPQHTPAQRLTILSQTVLKPLDRQAERAVRTAASRAFGITAISPNALTHALFFLVACIRMMREVTAAYGHRPTTTTTVHLIRRLVVEAGKVGGIDIAVAAMGAHFLTGLVERIGAGAAESAYAAQRMARLGIITMAMCRPVPFRNEELPSLSSLAGNLVQRAAAS